VRSLVLVLLSCLLELSLSGCNLLSKSSVEEVSIPTPLGPLVIKLNVDHKVPSLSAEQFAKTPLGVSDGKLEPGAYHPVQELRFAIWVPDGCTSDAGKYITLDPAFTADFLIANENDIKQILQEYEEIPPRIRWSQIFIESESVQFSCGDAISMKVVKGSRLAGWKVGDRKLLDMERAGTLRSVYPSRMIKVTAVAKSRLARAGYSPTVANMSMQTRELRLHTDTQSLHMDKDSRQLYEVFRATFENVEVEGKPRTLRFQGLSGFFEGNSFFYAVTVVCLEGPTTHAQWQTLQAVLESFRYE
jgi:hypothetical protein